MAAKHEITIRKDNSYLVHVTNRFPYDNTLPVSTALYRGEEKIFLSPEEAPLTRPTLHLTLNHMVEDHRLNTHSTSPFAVMIPFSELREQIYGGYAEDLFLLGPLSLSTSTLAFVPLEKLPEMKQQLAQFKGKIVPYSSKEQSLTQAINAQLDSLKAYKVEIKNLNEIKVGPKTFFHKEFILPFMEENKNFFFGLHATSPFVLIEFALDKLCRPTFFKIAKNKKERERLKVQGAREIAIYLAGIEKL